MKKILPVVFDKTKDLSKKLTAINVAHIFLDENNQEILESLRTGKYKLLDRFFLTSSPDIVSMITQLLPGYRIYLIGSDEKVDKAEVCTDVNEIIHRYTTAGIKYYSYKEIREVQDVEVHRESIDLDVFIVGKVGLQTMMSRLCSVIDCVRGTKIIDGKYVFNKICTYYCGEKRESLLQILRVDKFVDLKIPTDVSSEIISQTNNTKIYNLIDKTKYDFTWRAYSQLVDYIDSLQLVENKNTSCPKIGVCIDIGRVDPKMKLLNVQDELKSVIASAVVIHEREKGDPYSEYGTATGSENDDRERLYVHSDVFAIGTEKIIKHYMSLFKRYGIYKFREVQRNGGCIISIDDYNDLSPKARLRSEVQLFEHVHSFGDVVLSEIKNINENSGLMTVSKSIVIVTYYGIYEQFLYVKRSLELMGYTVHNFSYTATFNDGGDRKVLDDLTVVLNSLRPQYVLWWVFNVNTAVLYELTRVSPLTKHLYFNWDEPYNWKFVDAENKAKFLSTAFVTCEETTKRYLERGTLHAYCLYPGYSPNLHKPYWLDRTGLYIDTQKDYKYDSDISFVCTNLYDDPIAYPDPIVNRKKIVDALYIGQKIYGFTFAIYGPEKFREMYPHSYKGFIKYENTNEIINKSRINLCTHVVGNKNGYLNERVFLIIGAGGLLLIDPIPGVENVLVNGVNCVFLNQSKICNQVRGILDNYHFYEKIKHNAYETSKNYTWDDWGMNIEQKLCIDYS